MLPEEILADSFVYLRRVELISSVYSVSRLFYRVADKHPSLRSVIHLDRIVTRSRLKQVEPDYSYATASKQEGLFIYARTEDQHYSIAIYSPSEVSLMLAPHLRFASAFINHYEVTPTIVAILRQLAPALVESYLDYEWYHPKTRTGAREIETSYSSSSEPSGLATSSSPIAITPPTRITYSELSSCDQLMEVFSPSKRLYLAGHFLQRTDSPSPPLSLLTLPAVLRRNWLQLILTHSLHEPRTWNIPLPAEYILVGEEQLVHFQPEHIFTWLHQNWHLPVCRLLYIRLHYAKIRDFRLLKQLTELCKEVSGQCWSFV